MDLIYRQTVLDALAEINKEVEDGDGFQYEKWREYFAEMTSPAQFQSGGDTISRKAVMESLTREYNRRFKEEGLKPAWIEKAVNEAPALAVRCHECALSPWRPVKFNDPSPVMEVCSYTRSPNGFCAWGKLIQKGPDGYNTKAVYMDEGEAET